MERTGTRAVRRTLALRFGAVAMAGCAGLGLLAACSSSSSGTSGGSSSSTQCARPTGRFTGARPTAFPSGLHSRPAGAPSGGFRGCGGFGGAGGGSAPTATGTG
jgi:hypothetical protein